MASLSGAVRGGPPTRYSAPESVTRALPGPSVVCTCAHRGEHLAWSALQSVFLRTMRTQNLEWLEGFSLDRSCQLCQARGGSLWHRCYKCPASEEFRRGYCLDFDLDKRLKRMPLSGVQGMLWTRLMLAHPSFGQDVPKPIRHEHVVWEVHPENGELDTRGFGDGSLRHGRMKQLACGSWGLAVLSED